LAVQEKACPTQLEFLWRDPAALHTELESLTGLRVRLTMTDNTSTMMSVKHAADGKGAHVRLHQMFLAADPEVVRALARWIQSPRPKKSGKLLDRFIRENTHQIRPRKPRRIVLNARGTHFDLAEIYDELNQEHFANTVRAFITWGRMPTIPKPRSIRFGSFSAQENVIRIHPLLDQAFVPLYFVRYIVFHEMLHAHLGAEETRSGRRRLHTREFKRRERAYPDYARAIAWESELANLRKLLRGKR